MEAAKDRLADLDSNLGEWQEVLELAATLPTRCGDAYRKVRDRTRKEFNAAVFVRLDVKGGRLCHEQYRPPVDDISSVSEPAARPAPDSIVTAWVRRGDSKGRRGARQDP